MTAINIDFIGANKIESGADFIHTFILLDDRDNPFDLTGAVANMQIRKNKDSTNTLLELTQANGRITLSPINGEIIVRILANDTKDLNFENAVYDLKMQNSVGEVFRIFEGLITANKEVTKNV